MPNFPPTQLIPKPHIVLTMGDPSGIGPEVCWKGLVPHYFTNARFSIVGLDPILRESQRLFAGHLGPKANEVEFISIEGDPSGLPDKGRPSPRSGKAALQAIALATDLCLKGQADAMVTAPVSKEAIEMSGVSFTGHTEWISARCGHFDEMMMMSDLSQGLHVGYLTTHLPLRSIPDLITSDLIERRLRQCLAFRDQLRDARPIAICGLNPHAGEHGLLGHEEREIITPIVEKLNRQGHPVEGPFPADTLFVASQRQRFAILLALYHDQGGIPFKMLAFDKGVNHTLGLPIIRTSVDHGTAWDIAWQGKASGTSMTSAIEMALLRAKGGWKEQELRHNDPPKPQEIP